ncbi:MAG: DUF4129 domain-containing protein [Tunicatimonas sp.]
MKRSTYREAVALARQKKAALFYHAARRTIVALWCGLAFLFNASGAAQSNTTALRFNDSVRVEARTFSEETIRRFQEDGDFDYGIRRKATLSWWERFKYWLSQQFARLYHHTYFGTIYDILFYLFCFAVLTFAILKLTGTSVTQLFFRKDSPRLTENPAEDNIYAIDFEKEIADAQRENNHRRVIRLRYIYALRKLADRQLIRWRPGKTNHDYQAELADTALREPFQRLSYYYEYAWYGNFPADQAMAERVERLFRQIEASPKALA